MQILIYYGPTPIAAGMTLAALGREMGALTGRDMDYAAVSAGLRWFDRRKKPRKVTAVERRACSFLNL